MTFVAIAVVFITISAMIGLTRPQASEVRLAAAFAATVVGTQLVLLLTR